MLQTQKFWGGISRKETPIKNLNILIMQVETLNDNLKYLADAGSVTLNIDER